MPRVRKKEVDWQRSVIEAVKKAGGYGRKWATQWSVGVPDLVLVLPNAGAVFVEVKCARSGSPDFKRTVALTQKQKLELGRILDAGGKALVVVFAEVKGPSKPLRLFGVYRPPAAGPTSDLFVKAAEMHEFTPESLVSVLERS